MTQPTGKFALGFLTRPFALSWVSTLLVVLWLCGRDALRVEQATALFLCGGTAAVALAIWCAEALLVRVPLRRSAEAPRARAVALALAALELFGAFAWMHLEERTFREVRPGTEPLHAALFGGTLLVSAALLVPWTLRIRARVEVRRLDRATLVSSAFALLVGIVAIELDRHALVDLYSAVHVWLQLIGLLSLDAALAPLVVAVLTRTSGAHGSLRQRGVLAVAVVAFQMLFALGLGFAALRVSPELRDTAVRAELLDTPLGPTLIRFAPRARRDAKPHPLLRYDQMLDAPVPANDWNIVLLSSDALRGDAIDAPGSKKTRSPRITALAAERCAYFRSAYAPGSRTTIGMGSLMLGRYSAHIDWELLLWGNHKLYRPAKLTDEQRARFGNRVTYTTVPVMPEAGNLAQRLRRTGFRTLATPWDHHTSLFHRGQGFDDGFQVYADLNDKKWQTPASSEVVKYALEQIDSESGGERFFQWIHLFDTHQSNGDKKVYRELVQATDAAIGELVDGLRARTLLDRTVFVLLADHGEGLGQHRATGHGTNLYEEQVRVPLLICIPGARPQQHEQPVSTLDATATLLELAGAKTDAIDGVNLWPLISEGRYPERRPVFTELHGYRSAETRRTVDLRAVRLGDWKLVTDLLHGGSRLFNLKDDPTELRNVVRSERKMAEELGTILDAFIAEGERDHPLVGRGADE